MHWLHCTSRPRFGAEQGDPVCCCQGRRRKALGRDAGSPAFDAGGLRTATYSLVDMRIDGILVLGQVRIDPAADGGLGVGLAGGEAGGEHVVARDRRWCDRDFWVKVA